MRSFAQMTSEQAVAWVQDTRTTRPRRYASQLHQMTAPELAAEFDISGDQAQELHDDELTALLTSAATG